MNYSAGALRYVLWGDAEVLRQIYVAVRDAEWRTVPARIVSETVESAADRFRIHLTAVHRERDIDFTWIGRIEGEPDGSLRFAMEGAAGGSFQANRIGICVLHPIEGCAGRECEIEHTSGERETARFPQFVSPRQPFLDVRAIAYPVIPGMRVSIRMDGDRFETEDQRNWTDDSFKTYSRPLSLPYPYGVRRGDAVSQTVSMTVEGSASPAGPVDSGPVRLTLGEDPSIPFPQVALRRVDLHLDSPGWRGTMACELANQSGPQEFAVFISANADQPRALIDALQLNPPKVSRWLLFGAGGGAPPSRIREFGSALALLYPGVPIGGGSSANFAELNRNRGLVDETDLVCWGINPQVHAGDEQTLIENLRALRCTIDTARSFCGGRPLCLSPVEIPHPTPASAAWVVGSLKHFAEAGVHSVTYRDVPGAETVLQLVEDLAPCAVVVSHSSDPLSAECLAVRNRNRIRLIAGNLLGRERQVSAPGGRTLRLGPYSVAAMDWEN